jgi:hypothetical protein
LRQKSQFLTARAEPAAKLGTYSGVICHLEKPFTLYGSIMNYTFKFTPSSVTTGKVHIVAAGMMVTVHGGGSYVIQGLDGNHRGFK